VLSRSEFEASVKHALRHYARADLLIGNPLLRTRVLEQRDSGATVASLRAMLVETAAELFASGRDQKLYRVLDLTYLNPAPKQEAAAERLGLPFSTYRRHLTTGVGRIIDWLWQREHEACEQERPTEAVMPHRPQPDRGAPRLSVVVLPFLNLSSDPNCEYLADGLVDSLTTDLARVLPSGFVISRSTAFAYRNRQIPARQIGRELHIRYVLEGSVLADETRVRVNAQLVDAATDVHLWAERFDKERTDILALQDEVVARLSRSVAIEMLRHEAARSPLPSSDGEDVLDLVIRGHALAVDIRRKTNADQAVSLFRRALVLDGDNVDARIGIASANVFQVVNHFRIDGRDQLLDEAECLLSQALAAAPEHIGAAKARAVLLRARGRFEEAAAAASSVIAQHPGEPTAYREVGLNRLYLGATAEAAEWLRHADRIAPSDPVRWTWLQGLGRALMQLGQDDGAVQVLRVAMGCGPDWPRGSALLAAAEALAGNLERAKPHLATFAKRDPGMTIARFAEERSSVPIAAVSPVYLRENERILGGLHHAGMPDA
jgi:TolB-like protein